MSVPSLFRDGALPRPPLVDVHVHLGPSDSDPRDGGELYYPHLAGEEYLRLMDQAGVEWACAFAPQRDHYREANDALRAWAATTGGRVRAFARLGGPRVPVTLPQLWMVRRALRARVVHRLRPRPRDVDTLDGFAGVKLLPHLDGLPDDALLDEIDRRRLPVLVHGGVHVPPRWIERHLVRRLRGPVIIAHLGSFPCDGGLVRQAVELAQRHPHVVLDTSGVWISEFLRHAAARVPEKLLFGSDAPLASPAAAWAQVAASIRDDDLLRRIGGETARRLFDGEFTQ